VQGEDANGCISSINITIGQTNDLVVDYTINQAPDCQVTNGIVSINVTGGSANMTYDWSDVGIASNVRTDIGEGTYTVAVTDNTTGCLTEITFNVISNSIGGTLVINGVTPVSCFGESTGQVDYLFTPDAGFNGSAVYEITDGTLDYVSTALPAGTYTINVYDAGTCNVATGTFTINEPDALTASATVIDAGCNEDGQINLTVVGGTMPYNYSWSNLNGSNQPQNQIDLDEGFYSVTISDANNCLTILSAIEVEKSCAPTCDPPVITGDIVTDATCGDSNGKIEISLAQDPSDYVITWNPNVSNSLIASK